ncbi:MAG: family 16 glycoside hydrolase [bacterium]
MRKKFLPAASLVLFLLQNSAIAQGPNKYHWYYYIIDRAKPVGAYTTLLYDKKGQPNIGYCGANERGPLKFARFDGVNWQITTVDPVCQGRTKMALDPTDKPHFVYGVDDQSKVMLASYNDDGWTIRTIDSTPYRGEAGYDRAIQVDARGRIHICYGIVYPIGNQLFHQMTYTFFDNGSFGPPTRLDTVRHFGKWNSMVLDTLGRPTVAYYATSLADLAFAYLDSNRWVLDNIDHDRYANDQGYYPSIKCDKQNNFFISFQNQTTRMLRLAYGNSGAWQMEDIVALNGWTTFTSPNPLALDEEENPYVAFHDYENGDLKLAYKAQNAWHIETVDSTGRVGEHASLVINPEGMPAISYYDSTQGFLRLAVGSLTPPPDTDGDLIADYIERSNGSDERDVDTDDDGLADGEEDSNHNGLADANETDPTKGDTDGDGILDGVELGRTTGVPAAPGMKGTDLSRFRSDADPSTNTNPYLSDTDGDGLGDGGEDRNLNGRVDSDESDPNDPDTDGDQLADGVEVRRNLSPLDLDSDDDGLADGEEDKNFNAVLEVGETDPGRADTDGEGIADGIELGVINPLADPDGGGKLFATDLSKFRPDADPATTTDPLRPDTDSDGRKDGEEDQNRNGRLDAGETNPLNADSDGDGNRDGTEISAATDPLDLDSDDDGLADGVEDTNKNGVVDAGETSPRLFDTDGDGVSDGVEAGVATGIADPDGNGPLRGSAPAIFVSDVDPATNSNPLLWDTDGDGLSDGEEDANRNGAVDTGETHFLRADTDADGLSDGDEKSFLSDPRDPRSKAEIPTLFKDDFKSSALRGWTVVDEGNFDAPSDWLTYEGSLIQASNIWGGKDTALVTDPHKPGTYIVLNNLEGSNYKFKFKMRSSDDDELGAMFQYRDRNNYYRFSMNRERQFLRITKIVQGVAQVITWQQFSYQPDRYYDVAIYVVDGRIQVYLDGRRILDVRDGALKNGSIAFYCWRNSGAAFREVIISGQGKTLAVHDPNDDVVTPDGTAIRQFSLSPAYPNPTSGTASFVLQAPSQVLLQYKVYDLLGKTVREVDDAQYPAGWHQIVWNGRNATGGIVPPGVYFMRIVVAKAGNPAQILRSEIKKIVRLP